MICYHQGEQSLSELYTNHHHNQHFNILKGFLAIILRHLADQGISCNVASGYYHDHLFVQDGEEVQVLELLQQLSQSVADSSDEEDGAGIEKKEKKEDSNVVVVYSNSSEED